MALVERLMGWEPTGEDNLKLPIHQFVGAMAEWNRGRVTRNQIISVFSLRIEDELEIDSLISQLNSTSLTRQELHDVLLLAEIRIGYDTPSKVRTRLGI